MFIFFILGLVLGALAVIFAFQNSDIISVVFMGWQLDGSLSVILALSVLTGILIALLLTLPELINNYFQYRSLIKKNLELQDELRKQKELTLFAKKHAPTDTEISHIEEGSIIHTQ